MMTSLDGKILSEHWGKSEEVKALAGSFEEVHEMLGHASWIVGRTTMEKDFTKFAPPVVKPVSRPLPRTDFAAAGDAGSFAVAIDGKGKLGWNSGDLLGQHVITVLTESVADGYLAHLQETGVSYLFAGKESVDLRVALQKLKSLFGIDTLMLEGGGHVNGTFLNEDLIDEYYQIVLPVIDGRRQTTSVFEIPDAARRFDAAVLSLLEVKKMENDSVLLHYKVNRRG